MLDGRAFLHPITSIFIRDSLLAWSVMPLTNVFLR